MNDPLAPDRQGEWGHPLSHCLYTSYNVSVILDPPLLMFLNVRTDCQIIYKAFKEDVNVFFDNNESVEEFKCLTGILPTQFMSTSSSVIE